MIAKDKAQLSSAREEIHPRRSEMRLIVRTMMRNPLAIIGAIIVLGLILTAFFADVLAPFDPLEVDLDLKLESPSLAHPFGTDLHGRDILSRVICGSRISLRISIMVVTASALLGTALGVTAGYYGGLVDEIIMRTTDIFLAIPAFLMAMAVVVVLGPGLTNAMIAMIVVWWPAYARLVRGQALWVKERQFVEAARAIGASSVRIISRHILVNCLSPLLVQATMDFGYVILTAAGLGFLGLGAQRPEPEWGLMVSLGRNYLQMAWWYPAFPGLAIALVVFGFNLLRDSLTDALNPRLRKG